MNELTEFEQENQQELASPLTLSIRTPSKANIDIAAWKIIEQCENGELNPLELVVKCTAIMEICEQIKKGVKRQVLDELAKEKGKAVVLSAKIEQKEVGTKYDYSLSPAWQRVFAVAKGYADKQKEVEKLAKEIPEGLSMEYPDPETGEMLKITRAAKISDTSFAITLAK